MKNFTFHSKAAIVKLRSLFLFIGLCFMGTGTLYGKSVPCPPNIDFENGNLGNWQCWVGVSATGSSTTGVTFNTPVNSGPLPNRHTLVTYATAADTDFYGGFRVTPPGGGTYSLKLGKDSPNFAA